MRKNHVMRSLSALLCEVTRWGCDVTVERGGHMTLTDCCAIQAFTAVARCGTAQRKHCFLLLLHNRRVYRGAAYELPEQICYNMFPI
jgi:hypothetical protein